MTKTHEPTLQDYLILAFQQEKKEDYQGAAENLTQALQLDPNNIQIINKRGLLYMNHLDKPEKAEKDFKAAIGINPNDDLVHYNLGIVQSEHLQKHQEALENFNTVINLVPNHVSALFKRGLLYMNHFYWYQDALDDLEQVLILAPNIDWDIDIRQLINKLSQVLTLIKSASQKEEKGDYPEALKDCDHVIQIDPNYLPAIVMRGDLKMDYLQDYDGALGDFKQVISINPKHASVYYSLGRLKNEYLKEYPEAKTAFDEAIRLDPNDVSALIDRGYLTMNRLRDYPSTVADFDKVLKISPDHEDAAELHQVREKLLKLIQLKTLAVQKEEKGDYQGALDDTNQILKAHSGDVVALYTRGKLILEHFQNIPKLVQTASNDLDKVIHLDPNQQSAYHLRGKLKRDLIKDYQGALKDFNKMIKLNAKNDSAYFELGILYISHLKDSDLNAVQKALDNFTKAINISIDIDKKNEAYYFNRGIVYQVHRQKYAEAEQDFITTKSLNPKFEKAYHQLASLYIDFSKYGKALEICKQAVQHNPNDAMSYLNLGASYINHIENNSHDPNSSNYLQEALNNLNTAITLNQKNGNAYYNRGYLYINHLQQDQKALADFKKAYSLEQNAEWSQTAFNHIETISQILGITIPIFQEEKKDFPDISKIFEQTFKRSSDDFQSFNNNIVSPSQSITSHDSNITEDFKQTLEIKSHNVPISNNNIPVPNQSTSYHNLNALELQFLQDYQNKLFHWMEALETKLNTNSNDINALYDRGFLRMIHLQNYQGALNDFNTILHIEPNNTKTLLMRGILLLEYLVQFQNANTDLDRVCDLEPLNAVAHYYCAMSFYIINPQKALIHFGQTLNLNPSNILVYYFRGILKTKQGLDDPLPDFDQVIQLDKHGQWAEKARKFKQEHLKNNTNSAFEYKAESCFVAPKTFFYFPPP